MTTPHEAQVWRVVMADDSARSVRVEYDPIPYAHGDRFRLPGETPERALASCAAVHDWSPREFVPPGQPTRAELAAERDAARTYARELERDMREARLATDLDLRAMKTELDALRAIVGALPFCTACGATATVAAYAPGDSRRTECCDDHVLPNARTIAYPYADAVRAWRGMR